MDILKNIYQWSNTFIINLVKYKIDKINWWNESKINTHSTHDVNYNLELLKWVKLKWVHKLDTLLKIIKESLLLSCTHFNDEYLMKNTSIS